jgi:hypothetical protein
MTIDRPVPDYHRLENEDDFYDTLYPDPEIINEAYDYLREERFEEKEDD